jgi:hypothetical protein
VISSDIIYNLAFEAGKDVLVYNLINAAVEKANTP